MSYTVVFDPSEGIVTVHVSGTIPRDENYAARQESLRLCHDMKCSKLLVDLRELVLANSTTLSCYDFGESYSSSAINIRIAHVLPEDVKSKNDVTFVSNVGINRGLKIGVFETFGRAKEWLVMNQ